ncbi:hypothetical protein [Stutzerimonas balearica]|uniref:hypothetical protein n=1 Tax=Stutzerimonas balearica TaxID=74829 RepID=UPI0028B1113E|nr:hypothetical protein [Stutzerimonas balearica]
MNTKKQPASGITERPILFNGAMVRAILEGRKTVTRRALPGGLDPDRLGETMSKAQWLKVNHERPVAFGISYFCPYGQPGDRLWVRESTEADYDTSDAVVLSRYCADKAPVMYWDEVNGEPIHAVEHWSYPRAVRPSIHMLRTHSRILLENTNVRVERLQDITRSDIRAEGLQCPFELASDDVSPNYRDWYPAAFRDLWNSTGGDWDANPWVWVVEFKLVTPCEATT